jgi:hypothetical protein
MQIFEKNNVSIMIDAGNSKMSIFQVLFTNFVTAHLIGNFLTIKFFKATLF